IPWCPPGAPSREPSVSSMTLGTIHIKLSAIDDTVKAHVTVHQADTMELLAGQLQQLRTALSQAGIHLGEFAVSSQAGDNRRDAPPSFEDEPSQSKPGNRGLRTRGSVLRPLAGARARTVDLVA